MWSRATTLSGVRRLTVSPSVRLLVLCVICHSCVGFLTRGDLTPLVLFTGVGRAYRFGVTAAKAAGMYVVAVPEAVTPHDRCTHADQVGLC